jgi:hypothetical protein
MKNNQTALYDERSAPGAIPFE